jgi:hypothetical protein
MNVRFRKAQISEISQIWDILRQAILRRKEDGSDQWQDGYPNPVVIQTDIEKGEGFVLILEETIVGYVAILINDEPEYARIEGEWLTNNDFVVFHRVAISENHLVRGLSKLLIDCVEDYARMNNIYSIKADTNYDNIIMKKIFDKLGYIYCGEVYFRGSPRKAYEKVLTKVL